MDSIWKIVAIALTLIQLTHGVAKNAKLPHGTEWKQTDDFEWYDWPLLDNEREVVFNRNDDPNRNITYVSLTPPSRTAVIRIFPMENEERKRRKDAGRPLDTRCEFDFDVPEGSKVVISSVRLWTDKEKHQRIPLYRISFTWHIEGDEINLHGGCVDTITCNHAEVHRELKKNRGRAPESAASAANETETVQAADLAKLDVPEGYYFVHESATDASAAHIKYANLTSSTVSDVASIAHSAGRNLKGESLALDKYGVCWQEGKNLTCSQSPLRWKQEPADLKQWATLNLLGPAQFIGVLNYAVDKMLVLLGYCSARNYCTYVELFEVRPDGQVFRHDDFHIIFSKILHPEKITMDMFYDSVNKQVCVIAVGSDETQLKYRRSCFEEKKVPW